MVYMAKKFNGEKIIPLKDISKSEAIPFDFLEKIFSILEKNKLLKSKKGVGGGYILAKMPGKITVKDIVNPLENTTSVDCSLCDISKGCLTKSVWRKIDVSINKTLKGITLKDLIR